MNGRCIRLITTMAVAFVLASSHVEARCEGDFDGNNAVAISELITAVNNALSACEDPVSAVGVYEGQGFEIRTGCMDPGANGTFEVPEITVDITDQTGSLYEGTLALVQPGGAPLMLDLEGTVDDEGFTRGAGFIPGVPVPGARFQGRLLGDTLALSVQVGNPTCDSDAAAFIGTRN